MNWQRYGETIREMRQRKGWSVAELAERSGLAESRIGGAEAGENFLESEEIDALGDAFGFHPSVAAIVLYGNPKAADDLNLQEATQRMIDMGKVMWDDWCERCKLEG